ncbi:M23 family metallopeptidase [Pseudolysinimonas sp.]|uniref:M23 family metallopeptidase n=1 Tax=Pseudolysinimonas sp. TaxID=2680009 RepID=UPI00286AC874|nr:M23 family metallopeptidase [Pseudolysinimonas sp.]
MTRRIRVLAAAVALALLPVLGGIAPSNASVTADYPSWEEVVAAQKNEAQAKALRASLEGQLQGLQDDAQRTQAEADAKGAIYAQALQAYDEQKIITDSLLEQTAAAQAEADAAYTIAAQVIAEMSKSGGSADLSPRLFTTPGSPDALLDRLELSRVIGDRYADLYAKAIELRNRAEALADQAEVAQGILDELRLVAEKAFQEAQAAAIAAAEKLAQTEKDIAEVRARIDYLAGIRHETTANYNAGIRAQWGDGAEGEISQSGWARPSAGYISSHFGMRTNPVTGVYQLHTGTDLAGQGCGATIRAAHAGVVTYAGWLGSWGYYVAIDHRDGTGSGYAHIQAGQIGVRVGQEVGPGQPIAKVGSTGDSTGCHLHYIVRINGNRDVTNPVPFMRNQGITL